MLDKAWQQATPFDGWVQGSDSPYRRMKRGKYELQWTSNAYILHVSPS